MQSLSKSMCQEWDLSHPPSICPEDLLYFVYLDEFVDDWRNLYPTDVDEDSLYALEIAIMTSPEGAPVIPGTGGIRKIRFGSANVGKSGADRVCYVYFPSHHIVVMMMAYPKSRKENLTDKEKKGLKQYVKVISDWLDNHS